MSSSSAARQCRALTRKNFINWRRKAGCSIFELICPIFVMGLFIFLRYKVYAETASTKSLAAYKSPVFPGLTYSHRSEDWNVLQSTLIANDLEDFFDYSHYPDYAGSEASYSLLEDVRGPLYFVPSDCLEVRSFATPAVEMPIIAVVGEWNQATTIMQRYLKSLIGVQKTPPIKEALALKLKEFGGKAEYPDFEFRNFTSKEALFEYTSAEDYVTPGGKAGICYGFQMKQDDNGKYELELYFNDQQKMGGPNSIGIPNTQVPPYSSIATTASTKGFLTYLERGYSVLHNLAANVILKIETGTDNAKISMMNTPLPGVSTVKDSFLPFLAVLTPFLILITFIPPVYNLVSLMVREKETRIRESMRMMGMRDGVYLLSWYAYYTLVSSIVVLIAWIMMLFNIIVYSDSGLILLMIFVYAQSVFGQIVFLASVFENAKFSGLFGSLIYFGFQLLGLPVQLTTTSETAKLVLSIFPQVALQQSSQIFGELEGNGIGLDWDNASVMINNYSFVRGLYMMAISFFVFLFLGLYLDQVLPKKYGERQPVYFCLTKKFCCSCCRRNGPADGQGRADPDSESLIDAAFESKNGANSDDFEPVSAEVARQEASQQILKLRNLSKVYPDGSQAVDGVNLRLYSGQIFALLGHNGAGKSTMISMLTGLLQKSDGEGRLFDKDLFGQMDEVREMMGVCPQHDVLFDLLTPEEHLSIFYDFKGGNPEVKQTELTDLINDIGVVPEDKRKQAKALSGGNRRKLSVAIALCANSRFVMLDEPTAGMDLSARRALWEMLKNYKSDRIVILTTHYMDEADVLGDRVGILSKGQVQCLGSPLFLKNRFGSGLKLTFIKRDTRKNRAAQPWLESKFRRVQKLTESASEIAFQVEYEDAAHLPQIFAELDSQILDDLEAKSYGIAMTSLEEVFLKANGNKGQSMIEGDSGLHKRRSSSINEDGSPLKGLVDKDRDAFDLETAQPLNRPNGDSEISQPLAGNGSFCTQLGALLTKRFHLYRRDKCGLVCEILVPVLLVILGLSLLKVGWLFNSPAYQLDTNAYPGPQRIILNQDVYATGKTNYTPEEIAADLPGTDDGYWDITYVDGASLDYSMYNQLAIDQNAVGEAQPYRFGHYQIFKADSKKYDFQVSLFANATSAQSVPYFSQYIYEAILKTVNPDIEFVTTTAPFPVFYVNEQRVASGQSFNYSVIMSIALALIPCVFIAGIIRERSMQLKHLQRVSGASLWAYWTANLIADVLQTYVPICLILICNAIFNLQYDGVWELLVLYPLAIVPWTYVMSFFFARDFVAQIATVAIHFLISGVLPPCIFILQNIPWTANLGDKLRWVFSFVPTFCVCEGIVWSATYQTLNIARKGLAIAHFDVNQVDMDLYSMNNLGRTYTIMGATFFAGLLFVFIFELDIWTKCLSKVNLCCCIRARPIVQEELDDDVEEERVRIEGTGSVLTDRNTDREGGDAIQVNQLIKVYSKGCDKFTAIQSVSFGVAKGECFALLGVNGAGKSTTFKSLTRDVVPTSGDVKVAGFSVNTDFRKACRYIGYCPQQDALFPSLTVEEHLYFYAKIKGIPADQRQSVISRLVDKLQLNDVLNKRASDLSGGNQRKLSVGIAILGDPPIVLLDEPSSGMDPEARRFMWSIIEKMTNRASGEGSAIVLTTHSMDEAEALSSKMGIMVRGGVLKCFGSAQHIKDKFGTGFEVEIKIKRPSEAELSQYARETLGMTRHGDTNASLSTLRINQEDANQLLSRANVQPLLLTNIRERGGLGSDLTRQFADSPDNSVRASDLASYCLTVQSGFTFMARLMGEHGFAYVEMLEQCGSHFKLRVSRQDKTIGSLFGAIESLKQDCLIQEYGVSQTSLEQIFQQFARQSYLENRDVTIYGLRGARELVVLDRYPGELKPSIKGPMTPGPMDPQERQGGKLIRPEF